MLTGLPGCGKTTVIIKLAELLKEKKIAGFYTQEMRSKGVRSGFLIKTFGGAEGLLSSINITSGPRVGKYRVNVQGFEAMVVPELSRQGREVDLYLIDEIGKMECFSRAFMRAVSGILDGDLPMVATVAIKGGGFIAGVKEHSDVEIVELDLENRNGLPGKIVDGLGC